LRAHRQEAFVSPDLVGFFIMESGVQALLEYGLLGLLLAISMTANVVQYRDNAKLNKFIHSMSKDTLTTLSKVSLLTESMMQAFKDSSQQINKEINERAKDVKSHISTEILKIKN
ncbi:MAG: hypothetical protein ACPGSG_11430, partial [Prolixibacteraceae bacterium]